MAALATVSLFLAVVVFGVDYVSGWASLLAGLCFFSGLTLASIGVLGFYVGRVFVEVKARPVIVKAVYESGAQPHDGFGWDRTSSTAEIGPSTVSR
jgi:hypothetical protein